MLTRRHLGKLVALGLVLGSAGCAYHRARREAFYNESLRALPAMRVFAIHQIRKPTEADLQAIMDTRPMIDHVSYERVNFRWSNVCTVVAGPPPCQPWFFFDNRPRR